jgi:hypothetical protein
MSLALEGYPRNGMQANGTVMMGTGGTQGRPPLANNGDADAARAWHVDEVDGFVDKALPNSRKAGAAGCGCPQAIRAKDMWSMYR